MAITSLFGPTPQQLIAAQLKEEEERDLLRNQQIGQQGREFGVFAPLYQAGLKFGDLGARAVTRSLFPEVQNPQLQQAQTIQTVLQNYQGQNLGDPAVLQKVASDLFAAGAPDAGIKALATAKSLTTKDDFVTGKPGEKIFKRGPGGSLTEVVSIPDREKDLKPSSDFAQAAVELGFGARANLDDYNLNEARAINNLIESRRIKTAAAGAAQTPTEKAVLPGKATQLGKVEESALQGAKTIQTADAIDRVLNTSFTGFGSDAKLRVGQIAEAFGATVTGTSETEQLKQLLAQLAQGQARSLPGSLSEKELAFLREAIGTGNFTVNTLRNVTKRLRTDALAADIENQAAQKYVSDGGDLNKFNFVQNRKTAIEQATRQINEREAKQRRIEELRKKQGGQ